jgi:hypothetical protein
LEEGGVDYYLAINRFLNYFVFVYVKRTPMAVAMVGTSQGNELLTVLDKVGFDLIYVAMVLKRKSLKGIDALGPIEFGNFELDLGFA